MAVPGAMALPAALLAGAAAVQPELLTVAENSGWQATARHADVTDLLARIRRRSRVMRIAELGRTVEGRPIPLVLLADPPVETAAEVRDSGRSVVFAFGNIHAGEVCGKEALLMLARDLALEPDDGLLHELVVALVPILNADGNERVSPDHRPDQVGPAQGVGRRENAQGLDLNRDHVKLESPEIRAVVRFLDEWDPLVTIDTHTTNGSRHRYALTYAAPTNPAGHPAPMRHARDVLLPAVSQALRSRTGYDTFFYGNFDADRTAWRTYSALPRFGGPYRGLRGQVSILSEAYAYADYRDRVLVTREFVREIIRYAADHRAELLDAVKRARRETIAAGRSPQPDDVVAVRYRIAAFNEPATIRTFRRGDDAIPRDLTVVHLGRFEAARAVRRPHAYLLEPGHDAAADNLRRHGVTLEPFSGEATVESYTVRAVDRAETAFQGHHLLRLEADAAVVTRTFPDGTLLVPAAQPLGTLAVCLLEPESADGLAAWNFFDVEEGAVYPVHRVRGGEDLGE